MSSTPGTNASAGWYRDPTGRARLRWWDGETLTSWASDGTAVVTDPVPDGPRSVTPDDAEHLAFVREVFLPAVRERGIAGNISCDRMLDLTWDLDVAAPEPVAATVRSRSMNAAAAATAQPRTATSSPTVAPPTRPATAPPAGVNIKRELELDRGQTRPVPQQAAVSLPAPSMAHFAPPEPPEPGPFARWWTRTKESVGSDLATHGLAYLGVLLLFVGVFGLVAFAFGDVAQNMRPVAEIGIAVAPFAAAWMLLRRNADIAGRALETAGGLLLPVMVVTSFLDGVPIPPDATGQVLVVALTVATALVAVAYWLWSRKHPTSSLRFLVAPVAWLSAGLAAMGIGREIPSGSGVAHVSAAQVAAITLAMAVSLAWARWKPQALLARPTQTAAIAGAIVVGLLAILTWAAGGYVVATVLVTGFSGLLVLELLDVRVPLRLVRTAQPLWWAVVVMALAPVVGADLGGIAGVGLVGVAGYLALLELDSRSRDPLPLALSTTGLVLTYLLTWSDPWWAFGVSLALAVWAGVRRLHPYAVAHAGTVLDLCAGIMPFATVLALGLATRHAPLAVLVGALLVLAAVVPARVAALARFAQRDASDHFWTLLWDAGMVVTSTAVLVLATQYWPDVVAARWMVVAAPAVLAVSSAVGPLPRAWRAWPTLALATLSWLVGCAVVGTSTAVVSGTLAVVALLVVAAVYAVPALVARWSHLGSLGLAGHTLALVAVGTTATVRGWPMAWALVAASLGLVATVVVDEVRGSCVVETCRAGIGDAARHLIAIVAEIALVAAVAAVLDLTRLLPMRSDHWGLLLAGFAVLFAALTRAPVSRALRSVLVWSAVAASVVGVVTERVQWAAIVTLAVVVLLPLLLAPSSRVRPAQWFAWGAIAPLVVLAAQQWIPSYAALAVNLRASLALVGVGGVLAIGSFVPDAVARTWTARILPTTTWLRPAFITGAVELVAGSLLAVFVLYTEDAGPILLASAALVAAIAVVSRVWSRLGIAALVGWIGVIALWLTTLQANAWIAVVVTAALLVASAASRRLDPSAPVWARAVLPLFAVAHVTAVTAMVVAPWDVPFARVLVALAALSAVVSLYVLRISRPLTWPSWPAYASSSYAVLAGVLAVWAGALCGNGWLALALALVAVMCNVVATRVAVVPRAVLVLVGSVAGLSAWLAFLAWIGFTGHERTDATVMLGAALTIVSAALLRWTRIDRSVLLVRASVSITAAVLAPFAATVVAESPSVHDWLTWWTVVALAASALACALVAQPLQWAWMRYVAVAGALGAIAEALIVVTATPAVQLDVFAVVSIAAAIGLLVVGRARLGAWAGPVAALSAVATLVGVGVSLVLLPDATLVPIALLVAAICSGSIGVAWREVTLTVLAPVLACAAWIIWADGALDGNPQWTTVPIGLTLLVVVGLVRREKRRRGSAVDSQEVQLLELVGVAFLVGSSYVQVFTVGVQYALVAAAIGLGVIGWAVLTRVRRRLVVGSVVVLASVALLVLVPLAHLLPAFTSAAVWVAIAGIGLVALLAATLLEQGRAVVRRGIDELHRLTESWE